MPDDVVIRVENLSKQYRIGGTKEGYRTFRETLVDAAKAPFQKISSLINPKSASRSPQSETIWALRDVSFEVKRGEVVGIIGRNGAGKSTLLKILSKITEPTKGRVELRGRVGSLLEVGTGFHPELTGHENVYMYGAILGMDRWEVTRKFDEIVAFAELEKFIETPVKRYSSGMYMRLAFAVAAHFEPEIILVDEVLAVGDASFQKKCLGKMGDVAKEGRTVLFVSHNMGAIKRLCPRALWIDEGKLIMAGLSENVVSEYLLGNTNACGECVWKEGIANDGVDELKVFSIRILNEQNQVTSRIDVSRPFYVEICFRTNKRLPYCRIGFLVITYDGTVVFATYDSDNKEFTGRRVAGDYKLRCEIPANLLNTGNYVMSLNVGIPNIKNLVYIEGVLTFSVEEAGAVGAQMHRDRLGVVRPRLRWKCSSP